MVAGRSIEGRNVTMTTTNASAAVTGPANTYQVGDVGRTVTGSGITAGTTIIAVASETAATLSANATTTNTRSCTLGPLGSAGNIATGYFGWSPESETESLSYSLAQSNLGTLTPDRLTNNFTPVSQRSRG